MPPIELRKISHMAKNATLEKLLQWKITKTAATRCQILRLKWTKFNFGCGAAPDPAGELTAFPYTQRNEGKRRKGRKGKEKKRRGEEGERKGREGCILFKFLNTSLVSTRLRRRQCRNSARTVTLTKVLGVHLVLSSIEGCGWQSRAVDCRRTAAGASPCRDRAASRLPPPRVLLPSCRRTSSDVRPDRRCLGGSAVGVGRSSPSRPGSYAETPGST